MFNLFEAAIKKRILTLNLKALNKLKSYIINMDKAPQLVGTIHRTPLGMVVD